ncbi:protein kinase [Trypanosoma rangeli SC58]|uniref:non-specific serine/threonine protein kinase n=1 Tax=Trypanosoma rangeli SC58 TaxID=429131 RepID=A0A061IVC7_TRYRA|nr:protein kinase [Trypanosoma rangeli SC58]
MPARTQGLPLPNMNWLEVWRTADESTTGSLGVACALGPAMEQIRWVREQEKACVYSGGGKRASLSLARSMCGSTEAVTPDSGHGRSTRRAANDHRMPTSTFLLSGEDEISPIHSTCDNNNGESPPVPRISGFPTIVRQWETQAAVVAASIGHMGCRRRLVWCDSSESLDDEDGSDEGDTLPMIKETARPKHSGGASHFEYSSARDDSHKNDEECFEAEDEEDEEDDVGDLKYFGEECYLACVPGDVLQNRFALVRQLGRGRSSCVWLAVDLYQCTVSRSQLICELDEDHMHKHFSTLGQPFLVAIKVFRCGSMYEELAQREALVLTYIREFKNAVWLQRHVSIPCHGVESRKMSTVNSLSAAPTGDGLPALFSGCGCYFERDFRGNSREKARTFTAGHLSSMRDRFTHQGTFGVHHCIVMDVMKASLDTVISESGPGGILVSAASSIIRSVLESLALLETMHILHTDIKPANILFLDCEADAKSGLKTFFTEYLGDSVSSGSKLPASHDRESTTYYSRTGVGGSPIVSPRPFSNIVGTPCAERCRSTCNAAREIFKGAGPSWARANSPYVVQLVDFDHAMMLPPCSSQGYGAVLRDESASCRKFRETVEDEAVPNADTSSPTVGDSCSSLSVSEIHSPQGKGGSSGFGLSRQFAFSLSLPFSSMCTTSLVDELERDILSRQCYKRGVLLQSREYRSPEIILGKDYNATLDIWSVACIAFELVFGRLLFDSVRDFMEASEREEQQQARTPKEQEQNPSIADEFKGTNEAGSVSMGYDNERGAQDFWCGAGHFDAREKNIDVHHLRSIILLLGAPAPRYILATPLGEYVRDFFDSHGRFIFLSKSEQMLLYCNDSNETNSRFSCACSGGDTSEQFSEAAHEAKSVDASLTGGNTERRVSAVQCRCRRVTPAWRRLREQIQQRLGKEEGTAFEDFLRRCLRWNPEERRGAHALLRAPWVAAAEDATPGNVV